MREVTYIAKLPEKTFEVVWTPETITMRGDPSETQRSFFDCTTKPDYMSNLSERDVVLPHGIRYRDLIPFIGHRCEVSIRVLPW